MIEPLIIVPIAAAIAIFTTASIIIYRYYLAKRLAPTDEPIVGEYRIELDVGTHIVPYEGTLYYYKKLLNPINIHVLGKIVDENTKIGLDNLYNYLKSNAYIYAMRSGTKKVAFISLNYPIEVSPYFKSEQGTTKKVVHATGTISKTTINGFQPVIFTPLNMETTLKPIQLDALDQTGQLLLTLQEKAPIIEEYNAIKQKYEVLQSKVDDLDDEIGNLKDEVEHWKFIAKKQGYRDDETDAGFNLQKLIKTVAPYALLFIVGWTLSSYLLPNSEPIILATALAALGFGLKWAYNKIRK